MKYLTLKQIELIHEKSKIQNEASIIPGTRYYQIYFLSFSKSKKLKISRSLITPKEENELRIALGFPPLPEFGSEMGQDGTDWDKIG